MLDVSNVVKRYTGKVAVDNVSFKATEGRIFGLLGPNGAGKTTTIRMITYITTPDSGTITFQGKVVAPWSQRKMGYLPEERGLYRRMKVGEQLIYLAQLKGLPKSTAKERIGYWLGRFDADGWDAKRVHELSKGMQQKVQFIATIIHEPDLLIFDEPFSGLDPINSELLQSVIYELKSKGKTILFASHRMEQVEQLCDDICMLSDGKVVVNGSVREIKQSFGRDTVRLDYTGDNTFVKSLQDAHRIKVLNETTTGVEMRLLDETPARLVLDEALAAVDELHRFEVVEPSLNEIFISVIGGAESNGSTVRQ
ncbi:MAG: ATP-binding cassette domain-containing protein [Rhodothermales bacterium]|nr:ATP-binding cassette domain-containing protein [Rhodothermales bacterium]